MGKGLKKISLASVSLILVLAGCGAPSSTDTKSREQPSTKENDGKKVELTVATVNNPDMIIMQKMTKDYEKEHGVTIKFVTLPENDLRKKVTEDVSLGAGKFDIVSIGTYDTPIWANNGWIEPLNPRFDALPGDGKTKYDLEDIFPSIRNALSFNEQLYALPFYGESSMLFYNKDMLAKAGVLMPESPTWKEVEDIAKKVKTANNVPGIVLRGMPGYSEVLAPLNTTINSFGGSWYDMDWNAKLDSPETAEAIQFFVNLLKESGQVGATSTGFTEALTLMSTGKAAMWYDATVAAGFLNNPNSSQVAGKIGYALAPKHRKESNGWLEAWSLAIESGSKHKDEAFKFITWATSKEYITKVGESEGWGGVPPGTRMSTYENPKYKEAAPFAEFVFKSIDNANLAKPTIHPVPYMGLQALIIPEWQQLGNEVSQEIAAAISGKKSVEDAIKTSQQIAQKIAEAAGYKK
ncbi:ABC transporter substrate-binding protein [Paenibacillus chitinolyticus]